MVGVETGCERVREELLDRYASAVQAPYLDRIEPEVGCRIGAVGILVVAIPATVIAEVDCVIVLHAQRLLCRFESTLKDGSVACDLSTGKIRSGSECQVR